MARTLTHLLLADHLLDGRLEKGAEIALRVDQVLIQDTNGTTAWQQFGAMQLPRIRVPLCVTYVDHNLLQTDHRNADDHRFLETMCARHGAVFSRPGNGISHVAHLERYTAPGGTLIGSDSHTCSAGAMAMLGIGAGSTEVAAIMAGEPFFLACPAVTRVNLTGVLPPWVSAKDVILELLRRLGVRGGVGRVFEYVGPGAASLTVEERATICNMTQELGATSALFSSDEMTRRFLGLQQRAAAWRALAAEPGARYDDNIEVDLSAIEPLIARPSSPDNVVPVRDVAGTPVQQVCVGSSVNATYRDLAVVAEVLRGRHIAPGLHMILSPGSRQTLLNLLRDGHYDAYVSAGVQDRGVSCGPCIGMGGAPASGGNSLRTFSRNFKGRSGTAADAVWLCSPETAAASAITGTITDPRTMGPAHVFTYPASYAIHTPGFVDPPPDGERVAVVLGPNILPVPPTPPLAEVLEGAVLLKLDDNVSTDEILPGGNEVLAHRSNIPAISQFAFHHVDPTFPSRAAHAGRGIIVGGDNWGQGSSREHAASALMYLGIKAVLARSFARIHESNLVNFGVLPLRFVEGVDHDHVQPGDRLELTGVVAGVMSSQLTARNLTRPRDYRLVLALSERQIAILLAGGLTNHLGRRWRTELAGPRETAASAAGMPL